MPRVKRHAETMPTTEVIIEGEPGNTATVAEPESRPPEQNAAQDIIESVAHTTSIPAEPTEPERSHAEQHETRQYQADPTQFEQITLGADNAAPKMRLYRSNRFQQIAIQFDEKPIGRFQRSLRFFSDLPLFSSFKASVGGTGGKSGTMIRQREPLSWT